MIFKFFLYFLLILWVYRWIRSKFAPPSVKKRAPFYPYSNSAEKDITDETKRLD